MLNPSRRIFNCAISPIRSFASTSALYRRDKKSGKRLKDRKERENVFPEKFEQRMKSWGSLLSTEIIAESDRQGNVTDADGIASCVRGCQLLQCSFDAMDGKILEFAIGSSPLPVKMNRKGLPLMLRGGSTGFGHECIFWSYDGEQKFRVKARDLHLDMRDMIGMKFTLEVSDSFGVRSKLSEFIAGRDKWFRFRGYPLLQHAYRALPMPLEVADRKVNFVQKLNVEQEKAVCAALNKRRPLVSIQGPPGTGKTYVVTEIILQALRSGQKILVCAPSNPAVDNILRRVIERVDACRLDSTESDVSFNEVLKNHSNYNDLTSVFEQLNTAITDREDDDSVDSIAQRAFGLHSEMKKSIIKSKSVIFCTMSSSSILGLRNHGFQPDIVLIDEAGQAMECATWVPLLHGTRGVLVGDHRQLSAVVHSAEAARGGLGQSLMESLNSEFGKLINFMLTIQYRMNEKICHWSNDQFYESRIRSDDLNAHITLSDISRIPKDHVLNSPLIMVDTELSPYDVYSEKRPDSSYINYGEAQVVSKYVGQLLKCGVAPEQVGVISPYSGQVQLLKKMIDNRAVTISSVDAFQGQQKEVIVMSLVRNNKNKNLGFLRDDRRMNVAATRARRQFVLVSSRRMMAEHKPMEKLYEVIKEHGKVIAPSEFGITLDRIVKLVSYQI